MCMLCYTYTPFRDITFQMAHMLVSMMLVDVASSVYRPILLCYAEYIGNVPTEQREQILRDINREAMRLIQVQAFYTFAHSHLFKS